MRAPDYLAQVIKQVPYPENYYETIASYKERNNLNLHDKFYSRLPPQVRFQTETQN